MNCKLYIRLILLLAICFHMGCQEQTSFEIVGFSFECPEDINSQVLGSRIPEAGVPKAVILPNVNIKVIEAETSITLGECVTSDLGECKFRIHCNTGTLVRIVYSKPGYQKCEHEFGCGSRSDYLHTYARMKPQPIAESNPNYL